MTMCIWKFASKPYELHCTSIRSKTC